MFKKNVAVSISEENVPILTDSLEELDISNVETLSYEVLDNEKLQQINEILSVSKKKTSKPTVIKNDDEILTVSKKKTSKNNIIIDDNSSETKEKKVKKKLKIIED